MYVASMEVECHVGGELCAAFAAVNCGELLDAAVLLRVGLSGRSGVLWYVGREL